MIGCTSKKKIVIQATVLAVVFGASSLVYGSFHTMTILDHAWWLCSGFLAPFIVDALRPVVILKRTTYVNGREKKDLGSK